MNEGFQVVGALVLLSTLVFVSCHMAWYVTQILQVTGWDYWSIFIFVFLLVLGVMHWSIRSIFKGEQQ